MKPAEERARSELNEALRRWVLAQNMYLAQETNLKVVTANARELKTERDKVAADLCRAVRTLNTNLPEDEKDVPIVFQIEPGVVVLVDPASASGVQFGNVHRMPLDVDHPAAQQALKEGL